MLAYLLFWIKDKGDALLTMNSLIQQRYIFKLYKHKTPRCKIHKVVFWNWEQNQAPEAAVLDLSLASASVVTEGRMQHEVLKSVPNKEFRVSLIRKGKKPSLNYSSMLHQGSILLTNPET